MSLTAFIIFPAWRTKCKMECSSSQVINSVRSRKLLSNNCLQIHTHLTNCSSHQAFKDIDFYFNKKLQWIERSWEKKVLYNSKSQAQLANLKYMFRLQLCECSISKATPSSSQNIWGLILQCAKYLMQVSSQPAKFSVRQMFCTSQDPLPSVRIGFLNNYSF